MLISKPLKTDRSLVAQQDLNFPTSGMKTTTRYNLVVGVPVSGIKPFLTVSGGIKFKSNGNYRYKVIGNNMIPGLILDQYTGEISGTPLVTDVDQFGHVYHIISQKSTVVQIRIEVYDYDKHRARNVTADTKYAIVQFFITWPEIQIAPSTTNITRDLGTDISFNIFVDNNLKTTVSGGGSAKQSYEDAEFKFSFDVVSMRKQFDANSYPSIYNSISKTTFGDLNINPLTGDVSGSLGAVTFLNGLIGKIYFNVEDKYGNIGSTSIQFTWVLLPLVVTQSFSSALEINLLTDTEALDKEICTNITGGLKPYKFIIDNPLYSEFELYNKDPLPKYKLAIKSPITGPRAKYIDKSTNSYIPIKITDRSTGGINGDPQLYEITNIIINVHNKLLPLSPDVVIERSVGDIIPGSDIFNVTDKDSNNLYNGYPIFTYSASMNFPNTINTSTGGMSTYTVVAADLPSVSGSPKDVIYKLTDTDSNFIQCKHSFYLYPALSITYPSTLAYPVKEGTSLTTSIGSTTGGVPISANPKYRYTLKNIANKDFADPTVVPTDLSGSNDFTGSISNDGSATKLMDVIKIPNHAGSFVCNAVGQSIGNNVVVVYSFKIETTDKLGSDSNYAAAHTKISPTFQAHIYAEMRCNGLTTSNIPDITYYVTINDSIDTSKYVFGTITGGYGPRTYSIGGSFDGFILTSAGGIGSNNTYSSTGDLTMSLTGTDSLSNTVVRKYRTVIYNPLSVVPNTTGTISKNSVLYYKIDNGTMLNYNPVVVTGGSGVYKYSFDAAGLDTSITRDGITYTINSSTGAVSSNSSNYIVQTYIIPIHVYDTKTTKIGKADFNLWTAIPATASISPSSAISVGDTLTASSNFATIYGSTGTITYTWYSSDGSTLGRGPQYVTTAANSGKSIFAIATYVEGNVTQNATSPITSVIQQPPAVTFSWVDTNKTPDVTKGYRCVEFGNGVFAAGGSSGIIWSDNGVDWQEPTATPPSNKTWTSGVFTGSKFFFISSDGFITSSSDGKVWATSPSAVDGTGGTLSNYLKLAYSAGTFLTIGDNAYYSKDGLTWTKSAWSTPAPLNYTGIAGGVDQTGREAFMALNANGYQAFYTNDITSFADWTVLGSHTTVYVGHLVNSFITACDSGGGDHALEYLSADASAYRQLSIRYGANNSSISASFSNSKYVNNVIIQIPKSQQISVVYDGTKWDAITFPSVSDWRDISYGQMIHPITNTLTGIYVAVAPDLDKLAYSWD